MFGSQRSLGFKFWPLDWLSLTLLTPDPSPFSLSESAITKVQSPPTRTSRRYQGKAKSIRPPEPEVDVQLLETLCKENDCNAEEVRKSDFFWVFFFYVIKYKIFFRLCASLQSFSSHRSTAGEERVPEQFLRLPGLVGSVKIIWCPSGKVSVSLSLPLSLRTRSCLLFTFIDVRMVLTQAEAGGPYTYSYDNSGDRMPLFADRLLSNALTYSTVLLCCYGNSDRWWTPPYGAGT